MKQNTPYRPPAGHAPLRSAPPPGQSPPCTPEREAQLKALRALCLRLGRTPLREELPPRLRMGLASSFGTLRAAFAQLGLRPLSRQEARALRQAPSPPQSGRQQTHETERTVFPMLRASWFQNPNHGAFLRKEDVLPRLSRELGIPDLAERIEAFRRRPSPEGLPIRGRGRTTLRLLIPELLFSEPIDGGDCIWIYLGQSLPAYCLSPA